MTRRSRQFKYSTDDPDMALIQAMVKGHVPALETLYARYGPGLLTYLKSRLEDSDLAEEVLQDVMLAAWKGAARFRGECRVRTWLMAITRNRAINAHRRRHQPISLPLDWAPPAILSQASHSERLDQVLDLEMALSSLPDQTRETIELVFYHGLSAKEAAYIQKIAPGTVKSRLHRAMNYLRKLMTPEYPSDE